MPEKRTGGIVRNAVFIVFTAAAAAMLIVSLMFPVLRIAGVSMSPTLTEGNIVIVLRNSNVSKGDLIAFSYNNKILVKRVIAAGGEKVSIDDKGNVYVDDRLLAEPYLAEGAKAPGNCDISWPYQVPEARFFVLGDHRETSSDSRSEAVGCIARDQIIGRLVFRVWPLNRFGTVG